MLIVKSCCEECSRSDVNCSGTIAGASRRNQFGHESHAQSIGHSRC